MVDSRLQPVVRQTLILGSRSLKHEVPGVALLSRSSWHWKTTSELDSLKLGRSIMYCGIDQRVTVVDRLPRLVDVLNLWLRKCELLRTCKWDNERSANFIFSLQSIFGRHFEVPISACTIGRRGCGCAAVCGAICRLHEMNGPLCPTWNLVTTNQSYSGKFVSLTPGNEAKYQYPSNLKGKLV